MEEKQEVPQGYKVCEVTGYLESLDGKGISPRIKTAFLKSFKKTGDKTRSIESQGFRYSELEWHLQNDHRFQYDLKETLLAMKHEIEGVMFTQALENRGDASRREWLQVNFPEEYVKKALPKGQKQKSRLDGLLDDLT